ncbi:MAG: twin-arginine translocase TatA/TatE family subunit [Anaerolineae bacterium]
MEFLGIGAGELLVILLIALIALGPERLPEVADQLGRSLAWLRQVSDEITRSVSAELAVPKRQAWKPQSGPGPAGEPEVKAADSETGVVEPQEGSEESSEEEEKSS